MASTHDLEQQVAELTQQVAELRELLGRREDVRPPAAPATREAKVSRRGLLTSLPALAAAGAGAAALTGLAASPAHAAAGDPMLLGQVNDPGGQTTSLSMPDETDVAIDVTNGGIHASTMHIGDQAEGDNGDVYVLLEDQIALAVYSRNLVRSAVEWGGTAIYASGKMAPAISLDAWDGAPNGVAPPFVTVPGIGVQIVAHDTSQGIVASTETADVLDLTQSDTSTTTDAAHLVTHGLGRGVYVEAVNTANDNGTVTGVNYGSGAGVWGTNASAVHAGIGVVGVGGTIGRGGRFRGGAAAVQLQPSTASTHPSSGQAGDLFVDASHRLWFCKGGTTWHQLA